LGWLGQERRKTMSTMMKTKDLSRMIKPAEI
jgi:hypothetical protein